MYINNSFNKGVEEFPKINSTVIMKSNKEYRIKKRKLSRVVKNKKIHIEVIIYTGESKDGEVILFGFVLVPNKERTKVEGIFVSNQINKNTIMINENFLITYYKEMSIGEYVKSEIKTFFKIEFYLKNNYICEEVVKHPSPKEFRFLRFSFGNYQTKVKFSNMYEKLKGKKYIQKSSYIRPDMLINIEGRYMIVEVENTFHNKNDFFWKLYKLYKTKKNVVFIFKKNNVLYHLELISSFQRMIGRKCNKFLFITIDELENGEEFKYIVDWVI